MFTALNILKYRLKYCEQDPRKGIEILAKFVVSFSVIVFNMMNLLYIRFCNESLENKSTQKIILLRCLMNISEAFLWEYVNNMKQQFK